MLCSEFVNEFPLCLQNKGTGKKNGGGLGAEKDHETVPIGFLMILERKQSNCFKKKNPHSILSRDSH